MTETQAVLACPVCQVFWYEDGEPARCSDPEHTHQRFDVHRHRTVVRLPDGTEVTAVSFDPSDPYAREQAPDFGVYLDDRWAPPWPHELIAWPDFGVPAEPDAVVATFRSLLERARGGERVEVGCLGGHGRTGTAMACLAVLAGHPAGDAVAWVRGAYCDQAVETADQEAFVAELDR